jgi:hypothetical protein
MMICLRIHLQLAGIRAIHGDAVITAQGENRMNEIPEQATNTEPGASSEPVPAKRARVAAQRRNVPPKKGKSAKKATPAKKGHVAAKSAKKAKARQGSKTAKVLDLLKRPTGATGADLRKATGWQAHSVRGFISGVLGRKLGLKVTSTFENGERRYALKG